MTTYVVCTPISALGIGVGAKMVVNKLIYLFIYLAQIEEIHCCKEQANRGARGTVVNRFKNQSSTRPMRRCSLHPRGP